MSTETGRPTEQEWAEALCREYHPMHWDVTYRNRTSACSACRTHAHRLAPLIAREREAGKAEGMAAVAGPMPALSDMWRCSSNSGSLPDALHRVVCFSCSYADRLRATIPTDATEALARINASS